MLEERTFVIDDKDKAPDWPHIEYDRSFISAFNAEPGPGLAELKGKLHHEGNSGLANQLDDPVFVGKFLYYCGDLDPSSIFNYFFGRDALNRFYEVAMYHFFAAPNWNYQCVITSARKVLPRIAFSLDTSLIHKILETFVAAYTNLNSNFGVTRRDFIKVILTSIYASMKIAINQPYTKQEYMDELAHIYAIPRRVKEAYYQELELDQIWLNFTFPSIRKDKTNFMSAGTLKKMSRTFRKTYDRYLKFDGYKLQYFKGRSNHKLAGEISLEKATCEFVKANGNIAEHVLIKNRSVGSVFIWKIDKGRRKEAKNQELQLLGATTAVLKNWAATINYMAFMARIADGMNNGLLSSCK